jgi:hypothetical protein
MDAMRKNLRGMRVGLVLALLTLVYGFGLGAAFGAAEDGLKDHLRAGADAVFQDRYDGDAAKRDKVTAKAWTYLKRAHLHANGLGATALALILLLALLPARGTPRLRPIVSFALGLGGLGYAFFWMAAGLKAPGLGSTGAAKEALEWLAIPTSGLLILGLLLTLYLTVVTLFRRA